MGVYVWLATCGCEGPPGGALSKTVDHEHMD